MGAGSTTCVRSSWCCGLSQSCCISWRTAPGHPEQTLVDSGAARSCRHNSWVNLQRSRRDNKKNPKCPLFKIWYQNSKSKTLTEALGSELEEDCFVRKWGRMFWTSKNPTPAFQLASVDELWCFFKLRIWEEYIKACLGTVLTYLIKWHCQIHF